MSRVTVSMADVILSCRCWIFLILSAYTVFLMYPHRKKSSGERDLGFEVARVLVHPFQSRHQGIWPPRSPYLSPRIIFEVLLTVHLNKILEIDQYKAQILVL